MQYAYLSAGLISSLKGSSYNTIMMESIPQRNKPLMGTIMQLSSGITVLLNTAYIQFVNNTNTDF